MYFLAFPEYNGVSVGSVARRVKWLPNLIRFNNRLSKYFNNNNSSTTCFIANKGDVEPTPRCVDDLRFISRINSKFPSSPTGNNKSESEERNFLKSSIKLLQRSLNTSADTALDLRIRKNSSMTYRNSLQYYFLKDVNNEVN